MKRILIFSLVYYPRYIGGAEVAVKEITDRLPAGEFQFDMITLRKHAPAFERIGNVNVYRVGLPWRGKSAPSSRIFPLSKYLFAFTAFFKAISLHKQKKYDAIWSIMANYAGFAAVFFKMKHPGVPFILTLQEGDPIPYIKRRVRLVYPLFKKIFLKADRIQAISSYLADFARDMGATCPIAVVPNGVDLGHFSRYISMNANTPRGNESRTASAFIRSSAGGIADAERSEAGDRREAFSPNAGGRRRKELVPRGEGFSGGDQKDASSEVRKKIRSECGFADADAVLVTASRLVTKNAVGDVIESLAYLPPEAKFLILGTGHLESELKAKAKHLNLADRVRFHGFVGHDRLPDYLAASDIFVRPSLSEGLGNSFLEAMAAGIPVIATPVGGIPDFLKDGETGLFCEAHNPRSIAQKVEKLMRDKESRNHIIEKAFEMVREKYTWTKVAGEMRNILM